MIAGLENVRLSMQAKERLIRIKSKTGIQQWNVLCRWAFCLSLAEEKIPSAANIVTDSNVEMAWRTFTGAGNEGLYIALIKARCIRDGLPTDDEMLARQFKLHLHRGINYMSVAQKITGINDLLNLILAESNK